LEELLAVGDIEGGGEVEEQVEEEFEEEGEEEEEVEGEEVLHAAVGVEYNEQQQQQQQQQQQPLQEEENMNQEAMEQQLQAEVDYWEQVRREFDETDLTGGRDGKKTQLVIVVLQSKRTPNQWFEGNSRLHIV